MADIGIATPERLEEHRRAALLLNEAMGPDERPNIRCRAPALSQDRKVEWITHAMKSKRLKMRELHEGIRRGAVSKRAYRRYWEETKQYTVRALDDHELLEEINRRGIQYHWKDVLTKEIQELQNNPRFKTQTYKQEDMDHILNATAISEEDIYSMAPNWVELLRTIYRPPHAYTDTREKVHRKVHLNLSMMAFSQSTSSNAQQTAIGFYLLGCGLPRQGIELLHQFGICVSDTTLGRLRNDATKAMEMEEEFLRGEVRSSGDM